MGFFGFLIPVTAFLLLIIGAWDWLVKKRRITLRGWCLLIIGACALFLAWREYRVQTTESRRLLETIVREGERLESDDFQLKLTVSAYGGLPAELKIPSSFSLHMYVGNILASGDLVLRKEPAEGMPRGRDPHKWLFYYGQNLFVSGIEHHPYLSDLIGQRITTRVYVNTLSKLKKTKWTYRVTVYIKGREISGEPDKDGWFQTIITRDMLYGKL